MHNDKLVVTKCIMNSRLCLYATIAGPRVIMYGMEPPSSSINDSYTYGQFTISINLSSSYTDHYSYPAVRKINKSSGWIAWLGFGGKKTVRQELSNCIRFSRVLCT
jgi:hypothetical protein